MTERASLLDRLRARAVSPVDPASMAAFRVLFGLLLFTSVTRYALEGWIRIQLVDPKHQFKYFGLEWIPNAPLEVLQLEFAAMAVLALCLAAGFLHRFSTLAFLALWLHVRTIDATNYLNHYYLVDLLLVLVAVLPLNAAWSVDAWRRPSVRRDALPRWMLWLLRFQIGIVYFFAALAKFQPDWLLHGQPLGIWLRSKSDLPLLGELFAEPWVALAMSWAGFLFDLTIVGWMSWSKSRPFAYAVILFFHTMTNALFDIGMFPFIMPVATTLFFAPEWPRRLFQALERLLRRTPATRPQPTAALQSSRVERVVARLAIVWCAFHLLMPFRHLAYPGDVLWGEEGMRFSWRVMVREKSGSVTFHVTNPQTGRRWQVNPARYLTWRQLREMSTQPDLILQAAHIVARDFEKKGLGPVEVRADALVSLNGRAPSPLVDPSLDLAATTDSLAHKSWILPAPEGPPAPAGSLRQLARTVDAP